MEQQCWGLLQGHYNGYARAFKDTARKLINHRQKEIHIVWGKTWDTAAIRTSPNDACEKIVQYKKIIYLYLKEKRWFLRYLVL